MPFSATEIWKVISGYNNGGCHIKASSCGGDEYYAFDLAPQSGDAGGRSVYSPVEGYVAETPFFISGRGWFVKIRTKDGYKVHLYHLMNVSVVKDQYVYPGRWIGYVYNSYSGAANHLHIQVTNSAGKSIPIKLSGKYYYDRSGYNQWIGQLLQNNVLYSDRNYYGYGLQFTTNVIDFNTDGFNDVASSLRINPGCRVTLYEHTYNYGRSQTFYFNILNLGSYGFEDISSSLVLSC
jgi:murein DD-endopeptidase MepM/ murein hydrolase activator NlpD